MSFYELLKDNKLIVIIRGVEEESVVPLVQALYDGGVRLVEVTMNTPRAKNMITVLNEQFREKLLIGAGTVIEKEEAIEAIEAGASYLITPNLDEEIIHIALEKKVPILPGVMTPSEVVKAKKLGTEVVKIFPLNSLGSNYIKELRGPLGHIPVIAVGGVNLENVSRFLEEGAIGVGIGSGIIDKDAIKQGNFPLITELAKQFIKKIKGSDTND